MLPQSTHAELEQAAVEASAAIQMAVDSVLLGRTSGEKSTMWVRTYRMSPPAVTIGRHQRWAQVIDETICDSRGWDWTRRPTGGGALLHKNEINYAVIAPRDCLARRGTGEFRVVFERIGQALVTAFRALGVDCELNVAMPQARGRQHGLCGRSLTGYELGRQGRKLVAGAQLIVPEGILQHGTFYLHTPEPADRFWPQIDALTTSDNELRWTNLGGEFQRLPWLETAREFQGLLCDALGSRAELVVLSREDWEEVDRRIRDDAATGFCRIR